MIYLIASSLLLKKYLLSLNNIPTEAVMSLWEKSKEDAGPEAENEGPVKAVNKQPKMTLDSYTCNYQFKVQIEFSLFTMDV